MMDFQQTLLGDMGVDLSCGDICMPQHDLYGPKIGTALQEMAGKGVPQAVR